MASSTNLTNMASTADTLPPLRPGGVGLAVEAVSITLGVIATVAMVLRAWVRAGFSGAASRTWGVDDYLSVLGFLPFLPSVAFAVLAARYGAGTRDADFPEPGMTMLVTMYHMRAMEYVVYFQIFCFVATTVVKCAIGAACLRVDRRRRVVWPIAANLVVISVTALLVLVKMLAECRPFAARWNPQAGSCKQNVAKHVVAYVTSAIQAATDCICAIVPVFIVAGLQMPRRQKVAAVCILGLGAFASVATCVRMYYTKYYDVGRYPDNTMYHTGAIIICSVVECGLGIVASSLPPVGKLFRFYCRSGATTDVSQAEYGTSTIPLALLSPQGKSKSLVESHIHTSTARVLGPRASGSGWGRLDTSCDEACGSRDGIVQGTGV